jgi:hypothetical protein
MPPEPRGFCSRLLFRPPDVLSLAPCPLPANATASSHEQLWGSNDPGSAFVRKRRSIVMVLGGLAILGLLNICGCAGGWQGSRPVAPTTITQPENQTVTVGRTATFSVTAGGTGPKCPRTTFSLPDPSHLTAGPSQVDLSTPRSRCACRDSLRAALSIFKSYDCLVVSGAHILERDLNIQLALHIECNNLDSNVKNAEWQGRTDYDQSSVKILLCPLSLHSPCLRERFFPEPDGSCRLG